MQHLQLFAIIVFGAVTAGCVAAGAAAGGAAGAAMASEDEDREDLEYWLKTNDHTTEIGDAMRRETVIPGMERTHVKLVMGAKGRYESLPAQIDTVAQDRIRWTYPPELDQYDTYQIYFNPERVSSIDTVETTSGQRTRPRSAPNGGGE